MNYIKHLTAFFAKVCNDTRLHSSHVSLYVALFQLWNMNRFISPLNINRADAMMLSRIGSLNTYHKCMNELHSFGYIKYIPSHNPMIGSIINMFNFDTTTNAKSIQPLRQPRRNNDTTSSISSASFYKQNKHINKTRERVNSHTHDEVFIFPNQKEVLEYFKDQNFPAIEANKFFNHFQSNGWKVGGKTPMHDWQAAAQKWMLNDIKPNKQLSNQKLSNNKNYAEPL